MWRSLPRRSCLASWKFVALAKAKRTWPTLMWSALSADVLVVTWSWTRSLGVVCCWSFGDWLAFIFPWDGGVTKLLLQGDLIVESKQICIGKASRTCGWCDQGVVVSFHPWDGQSSINPWIGFLHSHSIVSEKHMQWMTTNHHLLYHLPSSISSPLLISEKWASHQ